MNRNPTNYGSITDPAVGFSGTRPSDIISIEFNALCDDIATNLYTINSSIRALQENLQLLGTTRDNPGVRNKIHISQLSTNQIASATTKDIAKLRNKVPRNDKQRILQVDKLEDDFKDTLCRYQQLQTDLAEKQKAHLLLSTNTEGPASDDEGSEDQQKQLHIARELQFEQEMMIEREERVRQIEADVLDVNQIMRELASLVHTQGDTIDTIENSIDHAAGNVSEGTEQLIKASGYQNRYRKRPRGRPLPKNTYMYCEILHYLGNSV